jgi:hypothetical protein
MARPGPGDGPLWPRCGTRRSGAYPLPALAGGPGVLQCRTPGRAVPRTPCAPPVGRRPRRIQAGASLSKSAGQRESAGSGSGISGSISGSISGADQRAVSVSVSGLPAVSVGISGRFGGRFARNDVREGVRVGVPRRGPGRDPGRGPGRDPGRGWQGPWARLAGTLGGGTWANGLALPWACLGLPGLNPLGVWAQHRLRGVRVRCTGQRRSSR